MDGAIIIGVLLIAFAFAGKPSLERGPAIQAGAQSVKEEKVIAPGKKDIAKNAASVADQEVSLAFLKKRNIFSLGGSYTAAKTANQQIIPENPYTLLAILQGKERSALFREFTGVVITATVRKKMIDGFIVTHISDLNVRLKRGKETKDMGVFAKMAPSEAKTRASSVAKGKAAPDNPYILRGVVYGKEDSKAIFQDSAGGIITAQVGRKLEDGFILFRIDPISVQLKRGKEVKVLKIF